MSTDSRSRTFRRPSDATLSALGDRPIATVFGTAVTEGAVDLGPAGPLSGHYAVSTLDDGRIVLSPIASTGVDPELAGNEREDAAAVLASTDPAPPVRVKRARATKSPVDEAKTVAKGPRGASGQPRPRPRREL
jgi:hypothetical protein